MASNNSPDCITPKQWQARGGLEILLGNSIFVVDEGAAHLPTIVLLHGFPTSSWDWAPIWHSLSQNYRLIALDMLGFGFSAKPNSHHYSIHGQADIVEALVKTKGLDRFHVLAHDYGDTVAQELLARQLEGVGAGTWISCCFLNGGLFPETHHALLTQKLLLSPLGKFLNRLTGYSKFSKNFSSVFGLQSKPSEKDLENFWWLINVNEGKHIFHNLITYMRDRLEHRERWVSALQKSTIPLGLINGSVDPVSGDHMVARYKELNCRLDYLAELPLIGHYPQVEAPDEVRVHYENFLASLLTDSGEVSND
ncbi:MAG: alpha/beta hydrolase [Porticoccaceae bacterium]|jgi:pimeloyl-ACP methyl ester carboxylesterase|nr:alpha/beta hydrolase [Porticoccaceae bacterium]MBT4163592.1 alpha/beta hydrolase [Porticoccaceae bacterium]MBT4211304.1 alpha/beta hydrolase [Porticoccaceae bacterium]MBT4591997.1 alpha/beta hydrolase [Porticoccaceae bacterium]MBT6028642.1 alpha/beta hydrolase [Porticoccaceae bacterium]